MLTALGRQGLIYVEKPPLLTGLLLQLLQLLRLQRIHNHLFSSVVSQT